MRTTKILALGLLLTLASAGCAGDGDDGTGVATAQTGAAAAAPSAGAEKGENADAPLKFAQCMRQNGITWFPDPDASGQTRVKSPKGFDPKKYQAAELACQKYAPGMEADREIDPELAEKARQMAKCMRENGVPDFPDPRPDGGIAIDRGKIKNGPGSPVFDKADEKCSQHMPKPNGPAGGA